MAGAVATLLPLRSFAFKPRHLSEPPKRASARDPPIGENHCGNPSSGDGLAIPHPQSHDLPPHAGLRPVGKTEIRPERADHAWNIAVRLLTMWASRRASKASEWPRRSHASILDDFRRPLSFFDG
jgi:hypothetical protein